MRNRDDGAFQDGDRFIHEYFPFSQYVPRISASSALSPAAMELISGRLYFARPNAALARVD